MKKELDCEPQFAKWRTSAAAARDLGPEGARDQLVECFLSAQCETFRRGMKHGSEEEIDEERLTETLVGAVRLAFKRVGGDFDEPTKRDLIAVLDALATGAGAWGTPEDVVESHKGEMMSLLERLPD
jgi:hypothetical protein